MGAVMSPCGLYRYHLWRRWGEGPALVWIMLNPSTADGLMNDPTISRCITFTQAWGGNALHVINLFSLRETDSALLFASKLPLRGPEHWNSVVDALSAYDARHVVCGWGAKGRRSDGDGAMLTFLRGFNVTPMCLGKNRNGTPVHPLYQPSSTELRPL